MTPTFEQAARDAAEALCGAGFMVSGSAIILKHLAPLQQRLEQAERQLNDANDALEVARMELGKEDMPFICDAIHRIKNERDSLLAKVAELEKELTACRELM